MEKDNKVTLIPKVLIILTLSFWIKLFDTKKIDAVVIKGVTHGYPCDVIPADIAISRGIKVYNTEPTMTSQRMLFENLNEADST